MRKSTVLRTLLCSLAALAVAVPAHAQGSRARPRSAYGTPDLAKLKWLEGSWAGTAADEPAVYERIRFADDSTVQITYYRDPGFSQEFGNGKLYISVGRVYHTFGAKPLGRDEARRRGPLPCAPNDGEQRVLLVVRVAGLVDVDHAVGRRRAPASRSSST